MSCKCLRQLAVIDNWHALSFKISSHIALISDIKLFIWYTGYMEELFRHSIIALEETNIF